MKLLKYLLLLVVLFPVSCTKDSTTGGLTSSEITDGLKEALKVGTNNSVISANKIDGYFNNSLIKIPFPQDAQFVMSAVQSVPIVGQPLVDELILKLNRAAENAAVKAGPIFLDAIVKMTITDAVGILNGNSDAATQYLKSTSYTSLGNVFKPDIQKSLEDVGAQEAWSNVTTLYNKNPFAKPVNTDLAQYTTDKALDGLFVLIAGEELKIRKDPAARINDVLKSVFGN